MFTHTTTFSHKLQGEQSIYSPPNLSIEPAICNLSLTFSRHRPAAAFVRATLSHTRPGEMPLKMAGLRTGSCETRQGPRAICPTTVIRLKCRPIASDANSYSTQGTCLMCQMKWLPSSVDLFQVECYHDMRVKHQAVSSED